MVINSKVKFDGIKWIEMAKYLGTKYDAERIKENNLEEIIPKKSENKNKNVPKVNVLHNNDTIEVSNHEKGPTVNNPYSSTPTKSSPPSPNPEISPIRRKVRPRRRQNDLI